MTPIHCLKTRHVKRQPRVFIAPQQLKLETKAASVPRARSEEHTSELQSLRHLAYPVTTLFRSTPIHCLKTRHVKRQPRVFIAPQQLKLETKAASVPRA